MSMKMAKASEADLQMALELIGVLDDIERGYFPYRFDDQESEISERLDTEDSEQYDRLIDNLRRLLNRGSIGRVIIGMAVVCDPSNELIDPEADTIEHHPKRQKMEDALLWTLYHHQGGSGHIGQPIRKLLDIGQFDHMTSEQIKNAKSFGQAHHCCGATEETAKNEGGAA